MTLRCDLHIHSCLSPCGDNDMTPANIAGMASLKGLGIAALTDHNTSKNCPAFFRACEQLGILPLAGMEITTAEDIHVIALFPDLASAMRFDAFVDTQRIRIKNRAEIFGDQGIMDEEDNILGEEPDLLINATMMDLVSAAEKVREYGGLTYPAHIDKEANGIIATLGFLPEEPVYDCFEFHDPGNIPSYRETYHLGDRRCLYSSDAHYLWDIKEGDEAMCVECPEEGTDDERRAAVLEQLQKRGML